jgi:hypothetical protein
MRELTKDRPGATAGIDDDEDGSATEATAD